MTDIKNKVVLVTGASSGIGRATALELAANGAKVMLTARREDRLVQLAKEIADRKGNAEFRVADVTQREQVESVVKDTIDGFGRLDALFNNAGIMPLSYMKNLHVDEWERMIDVNVKGLLYFIAASLPHWIERKTGHIINVSSVAGHILYPGSAVYSGTKHAVYAISEGLRRELKPYNIRVTMVSTGAVATELGNDITDKELLDYYKDRPFEPIAAEDIARATAYAIEQPESVDVNEMIIRPTSQLL
jgi:NADP-dependent 3-hydroxy acid dehydrogenase YdfG